MNKFNPKPQKSIIYSQNFIANAPLVANLIEKSSINKNDLVYEIGPGTGIITAELAKRCRKVIAVEIDKELVKSLRKKFSNVPNLEICEANFLFCPLPESEYKVFSNIPFNITATIVKKLVEAENPPLDAFLFVQDDSAKKFVGAPIAKETQFSLLIKPFFELSIAHRFKRTDFRPIPKVDVVLLRIKKRQQLLLEPKNRQLYKDFIVYSFNTWKPTLQEGLKKIFTRTQFPRLAKDLGFSVSAKPTDLKFWQWLGLFNFFAKQTDVSKKLLVRRAENKLKSQQAKLNKIHRTRVSRNWRKAIKKTGILF